MKGSADFKIINLLNINNLHPSKSADPSSQAVRKVLAKLKYSVLYKAESGFSILTEECLTFQTTSTARKYGTPESPSTRNRGEEAYQGRRAHEPKGAQYQQVIITARAEPPQKWRVGTAPNSEHSNYQHIATVLPRRTIAKYFSGIHSSFRPSHTFDRTSSICLEHFE